MHNPFPRPLILGHRGAPYDAPENTLASFARALEQGADGVELDVRRARDGVPVIIHDETLDRTSGARLRFRLIGRDFGRVFWKEPGDVARNRERSIPTSVFNWP